MIQSVLLAVTSLAIGASVGLSGVGGFLIVPAMMLLADSTVPEAVTTALLANLGAMTLTGIVSIRQGSVSWRLFAHLSLASAVAAAASLPLVEAMSDLIARTLVAGFLGAMGGFILLGDVPERAPRRTLNYLQTWVVGSVAQLGAVFAGIGGPAITVPALMATEKVSTRHIGTALLHGVVASLLGLVVTTRASGGLGGTTAYVAVLMVSAAVAAALLRRSLLILVNVRKLVGVLAVVGGLVTLMRP